MYWNKSELLCFCARAGHADGYMSSPERGAARTPYEDPYYSQYLGTAAGRPTIAPIIDEETGSVEYLRKTM